MEVKTIEVFNAIESYVCGSLKYKTSLVGFADTLPTERAPFVASRHFPRFIGEIYPKGESKKKCL